MGNMKKRRISMLVTPQTAYNLERLAAMDGHPGQIGRVVDKLVRDKMLQLRHNGAWERRKNLADH